MNFWVIAVSLVISFLSGLGVGGGGLFAVFLSLASDIPQRAIQGFNLLFFIFSASASVAIAIFKRRIIRRAVLIMAVFGLVGALGGTYLAQVVADGMLRRIFGIMLVSGGIISLKSAFSKKPCEKASTKDDKQQESPGEKSLNGEKNADF